MKAFRISMAIGAIAGTLGLSSLHAQVDGTWNTGTGNWSVSANWSGSPSPVPGGANSTINLTNNIGGNSIVSVDTTPRTAGIINIGDSNASHYFVLNGTGGGNLTLDNSGSPAQINFTAGNPFTFSGNDQGVQVPVQVESSSLVVNNQSSSDYIIRFLSANSTGTKTISNEGTGNGTVYLGRSPLTAQGAITDGSGVVAIRQNSPTSMLYLGGFTSTFTGGVLWDQGNLQFGQNDALGARAGTVVINSTGTLIVSAAAATTNNFTLNSNFNINLANNWTVTNTNPDPAIVTLTGNRTVNISSAVATRQWWIGYQARLQGNHTLTKTGNATLALGGYMDLTGGIVVKEGSLYFNISNRYLDTAPLVIDGGTVQFEGSYFDTIGALTLKSGSLTGGTGTLTASSFSLESGTISMQTSGTGSTMTKTTSGTVTISANATHTGATTVSAGTLVVSSAATFNNTSGIAINGGKFQYDSTAATFNRGVTINGGTLAYNSSTNYTGALTFTSGTLEGTNWNGSLNNLSIGAGQTISPGNSIGAAGSGNQTWVNLGSFELEFSTDGSTGAAGTEWDLLTLSGGLNLTGINTTDKFEIILVTMSDTTTPGLLGTWNPNVNHTWEGFVTTASGVTDFNADKFSFNIDGFQNTLNGDFSIELDGNNLNLVYTIPEPGTCVLLGLGSAFMLWNLRRKRNC